MEVWSGTMGSHCFLSHQLLFSMRLNLGLSGKCFLKPNCFSCSPSCPALPPWAWPWSAALAPAWAWATEMLTGQAPGAAFDAHHPPDFNVAVCTAPLISYFRGKPW